MIAGASDKPGTMIAFNWKIGELKGTREHMKKMK